MEQYPERKPIRLKDYDYSTPGAYFITVCIADRKPILWNVGAATLSPRGTAANVGANCVRPQTTAPNCRGELCSPANIPLSAVGKLVDKEIQKLNSVYEAVRVDKYCIMPDHLHLIISINADESGRTQFAPTVSRMMKQFKGSVSKQLGHGIWQKSFIDRVIRNEKGYLAAWEYIENNPIKPDTAYDIPDFDNM
ncbi:MAG: transposase [Oscillospiraceae bacterium]|nr:transposase [Oscillospiraceae bacterium]